MVHFFPLICSTSDVQNILETSEHRPKENRRPEPRKHTKDPHFGVFNVDFFRHYEAVQNRFLSDIRFS